MIRVPIKTWYKENYGNDCDYPEFFNGFEEVPRPTKTKYNAGDVVIIKEDNDNECIGVVLGVIDNDRGDLRTDARGMVSFDQIRPVRSMKELVKYPYHENIVRSLDAIKEGEKRRLDNIQRYLNTL